MKLDAKAFVRADKNKTKVNDFPETKKVKKLSSVDEILIKKDETNHKIRISSTASSYVDKTTGELKSIKKNFEDSADQVSATKNSFGVHIQKNLSSEQGVLFDDGYHSISMLPVVKEGATLTGKINSNKITFEDFVEKDKLEYIVQENGLKENIIIPCMRDSYTYQFRLQLGNLEADIKGNTIHFLDAETKDKVFTMGNLFMFDKLGERSKSIQMNIEEVTASDYNLTITPNAKWLNTGKRLFPVTIDPQIQIADEPILELKEHVSGMYTPAINHRMVLGVKDGKLHQIALTLNAEDVVSELAKNNIQSFKAYVELHYQQGKRMDESRGFSTYQGSTLIRTDLFKDESKTLILDVSSLIEEELKKYHSGREVSDVRLNLTYFKTYIGSLSDAQSLDMKISDDYVYLMDRFYEDEKLRPEVQLEYIKEDQVVEGTPFLEYETGKSGKTSLNIYNGNLSHSLGLGGIEADALKIDVGLLYDARLKKQMDSTSETSPFGKGWMLNVHQRLEKRDDYNKLLGSKDVTYYDGNNNPHTLREKWFYEVDDIRHYIPKDLVYIDNDQKMKYKDESSSRIYDVEYEVTSDEGLSLITTNSKMNYRTTSDKKCKRRYYITIANQKIEVFMDNGYLRIPQYYEASKGWVSVSEVPDFLNYLTNDISFSKDRLCYRDYISIDSIKESDSYFYDSNNHKLAKTYINCQLYYKNGNYYVKGIRKEFQLQSPNRLSTKYFVNLEDESYDIPITVEKEFYVDRSKPLLDYYENEDIAKVNSQIQQIEDYVDDLKFQTKSASNSVHRIEIEINSQKLNYEKMSSMNYTRDQSTNKNYQIYPVQIYDSNSNVDTTKTKWNEEYRSLLKKQTNISDEYQYDNLKHQIASLEDQLEEQQVALDNSYKKLTDYENQLANLKEQKEAMVAEQKKGVQDYIIDKSGNILGFNYYGKLVYITDSYENEITINYDDNKITEIASKTQRMYFNYDDHNYVTSIVDAQGRRTECFYDQGVLSKLRFIAENNKKQEIKLSYSSNQELCKIVDPSGCYLNAYQDGECGFRIIQGTKTKSISTKEITPLTDETKMVDVLVQGLQTKDYTVVMDNLNQIKTTHSFDVSGRLIHSYEEDLDTKKCTSTFIHFENKNRQFEVSFKEDKKFKSFYLGGEINKKLTAVLNLTKDEKVSNWNTTLNPDAIPTCKLAFARLDLRNLSQSKWLSLNQITLKAVVIDKNGKSRTYTSLFHNLSHQYIGIPFVLNSTDKKVSVSIIGRKSIDLETIKFMEFFEAEGTINTYNSDDQLIKTEDGTTTTLYEGFVDDKPTRMITIDEFGDRRTSYVSYDSNGRVVYEEDPLRNCKETFYDEKGKVVETREYNKECPTLAKVSKTKYDEHGNATTIDGVMRDEAGNYPQEEIRYLPNSSKVISTKSASGQEMCYGYDYHTDDLLEIASDTAGQGNSTRMKYRFGLLTSLTHHGFTIDYTLDGQGRKIGMAVAGKTLLTNEYTDQYTDDQVTRGSKVTTKTINGFESTTIKDKEGKLVSTITNDQDHISYKYDEEDQLIEVVNTTSGELAHTDYNQKGLVVKNKTSVDGISVEEENTYDDKDLIVATKHTFGDKTSTSEFKHDKIHGNRVYETTIDGTLTQSLEYDSLNRVTKKTLSTPENILLGDEFEYVQYGENSLDLIKEHNVKVGGKLLDTVSYTYDVAGNITNVLRDEFKTRYTYDKLNRLIREDNPRLNQTIIYKYDNGGNILLKKTYPYTLEQEVFGGELCHYTYSSENWKDQLVDFNGQSITYDEMGRPIQIGNTALSWNLKGQLTSFGDTQYTYNLSGIRTSKTVKGIKTDYYLSGNKILREMSNEKDIIYHYAMDKLVGFVYNNVEYIYERNIQGDILGIYKKSDLTKVAEYIYDAYGNHKVINHTVNNIGDINPIRYRGYYYDQETKLYYLNSRYYSPEFGRFISPDTLSILDETKAQINGLNLYMYCGDNPVMNVDPSGHFAITFGIAALIAITLGSSIIGGAAQLTSNALAGATGSDLWRGVAGAALGAGVNALALCLAMPTGGASLFIAAGASSIVQTGVDTIETLIRGEEVGWSTLIDLGLNFGTTLIGNYIGGKIVPINSGWFKPQKFSSIFLKPYGQKLLTQSAIGTVFPGVVNFIRKFDWDIFKPKPSMPAPMNPFLTILE